MSDIHVPVVDDLGPPVLSHMEIVTPGGGSGVDVEDEGTPVVTATTLNFTGAGVTATDAGGGVAEVNIPGGGSGGMVLIAETLLAAPASAITFSSIPNSYKDLLIVGRLRTDRAATGDAVGVRMGNGSVDAGNNYGYTAFVRASSGTSTDTSSAAASSLQPIGAAIPGATAAAGLFGSLRCLIMGYAATGFMRVAEATGGAPSSTTSQSRSGYGNGFWSNTASVVDVVSLIPVLGTNFDTGTEVRLYGMA
jgi:hypothetical protein